MDVDVGNAATDGQAEPKLKGGKTIMPSRRIKEITVVVQVPSSVVNAAYKILSTGLNQFEYKYAKIEIKAPEITEEIRK